MPYTYAIPMPTIAGMVGAHDGTAFSVTTPAVSLTTVRADFTLTDAGASDCVLEVGTATVTETVTIDAGETYVSHIFADTYSADDVIQLTVTTGSGLNLSGALFVQAAAGVSPADGLVSRAELLTALGISGESAADDAFLDRQISLVSEIAREYCWRFFNSGDYTETFYNPTAVNLREYPVTTLTKVEADGTEFTVDDVRADLNRGRVWQPSSRGRMDWQDVQVLEITYTGGYLTIPQTIREWCYQAIYPKWQAWPDSRGLVAGGTQVRKIIYPDAGSIEYQTAGTVGADPAYISDFLAGVPLAPLDRYRDPANAQSDEFYKWI